MCSSNWDGVDAAVTATLYKGIDEIVWRDLDPIGISKFEGAPQDAHPTYVHLSSAGSTA